ncbi:MAG: iron ABC transporter permease [Pseudomonadota bacterium]
MHAAGWQGNAVIGSTLSQIRHHWPDVSLGVVGLGLIALVCGLILAELALGPVAIAPDRVLAALFGNGDRVEDAILWQIRVPRTLLGIAVGAVLALSGCALQGLLRNPLAEPGLIGVTAGASLGAVTMIVLGGVLLPTITPVLAHLMTSIAAFVGASVVIALLFGIVSVTRSSGAVTLILAGVAINAIVTAFIGVLIYISDDQQLRDLTFWTMGALGSADTAMITVVVAMSVAMVPVFLARARALDLLQIGERAAFHAGLDVDRTRLWIALATAIAVGAVTAAAGPIGFIGLVAPHIARLMVGPRHAILMPVAALVGIALILAADLGVRLAVPPQEPPIGLATSIIGGPFFLWLLLRQISRGRLFA